METPEVKYKKAESLLRKSEQDYQTLLATIPHGIQEVDTSGNILFVNKAYNRIFGYEEGEAIGESILDKVINNSEREKLSDYLKILVKDQPTPTPYFEKNRTKEGRIIDVQVDWNYKRDDKGHVVGFISVITDITARKQAEAKLVETRDYLENIIESSLDGIVASDDMGYIVRANKAFLNMLGYREEEIIGKHIIECSPLEEKNYNSTTGESIQINDNYFKSMKTAMASFLHDGKVINRRTFYLTKDKKLLPAEDSLVFLFDTKGDRIGAVGVIRDITERRQAENKLRDSEEQARALLNVPFEVVLVIDKNGTTLDFNKAYAERFNKSADELRGTCCWELYLPDVVKRRKKIVDQVFQKGEPVRAEDEREGMFLDNVTYPIFNKEGEVIKVAIFSRDVTERKRAEELLRESEEKYYNLIEHANDAIVSINTSGMIVGFNKKAEEMFGYSREEVIGKPSYLLISQSNKEIYKKALKQFAKTGVGIDRDNNILEGKAARKGGEEFQVEYSYYTITLKGKTIATAIMRDITKRKEEEQKILIYQKKLKALTTELIMSEQKERQYFADFLHDEIGQQLFATRLQLEQLKGSISSTKNTKTLDNALYCLYQLINQSRSLTTELSSPILTQFGLEKALEWLAEETHKKYDIMVTFEDDKQEKPLADNLKILLYQSVSELVTNVAKHAKTKNASISIKRDNSNVRICVEDKGVGFCVSSEDSSDITKIGGIGLFRIQERLELLGGQLEIESQPNHGTQITLLVPLNSSV